jgi:hypothetical protein
MANPRTNRERQFAFRLALGLGVSLLLNLILNQGCARSEPAHPSEGSSSASEQRLPFHPETDQSSNGQTSNNDDGLLAVEPDVKRATGSPFRAVSPSRILPSGTLLTVQLQDSLPISTLRAGDAFVASVSASLRIDGEILLERGTAVTGRVEAVQSSATHSGLVTDSGHSAPGYVRLTLRAITLDGRQLAIQTSSLFARGTLQPEGIAVQKGRRLTFHLTAPLTLNDQSSAANHQFPQPATE